MPYVHLSAPVALTKEEIDSLKAEIGKLMPILPGKTFENTMMQIDASQAITLGGQDAMFLDVRLYKQSPNEAKAKFVTEIGALLEARLGIPPARLYINFVEMEQWASRGALKW